MGLREARKKDIFGATEILRVLGFSIDFILYIL